MAPKDKAVGLVWKYYHNIEHTISNEYASKDWEIAKQCAIIAVDEILNIYQIKNAAFEFYEVRNYWQEVKQEIEKL